MKSTFFSLLAFTSAAMVTETDWNTFFVTVDANGDVVPGPTSTASSAASSTASTVPTSEASDSTSASSSAQGASTPNYAFVQTTSPTPVATGNGDNWSSYSWSTTWGNSDNSAPSSTSETPSSTYSAPN